MPNEPERPVENLLRACAEKRRAEAGQDFELHSASRRILQNEVARVYPGEARKQGWLPISWARFWPTLGYSLATIAALGLVVKLMLPGVARTKTVGPLAKNENAAAPILTKASSEPAAQPVNAPSLATVQPEPPTGAVNLALADQKTQISRDGSALKDVDQVQTGQDLAVMSHQLRENEQLSAASAAAQPKSFMLSQGDAGVARQLGRTEAPQQLVRAQLEQQVTDAKWSNTLPASPVLASFRVELNGQELRVIDKDGSIYTGSISQFQAGAPNAITEAVKPNSSSAPRESRSLAAGAMSKMRGVPQESSFSFRVAGTNLSLNQPIIFRGQLFPLMQNAGGITNNASTTAASRISGLAAPTALLKGGECRVVGAATVGGGGEIQINALPSK